MLATRMTEMSNNGGQIASTIAKPTIRVESNRLVTKNSAFSPKRENNGCATARANSNAIRSASCRFKVNSLPLENLEKEC